MPYKKSILAFACSLCLTFVLAQHHDMSHKYTPPDDPQVAAKLREWKTLKFGLLMHWGTYSQWGIVESWSLCPEDEPWCIRRGPHAADWYGYKKAYEALRTEFNPIRFDPDRWAEAAADAGMRYMVFTTKHHDGFCMFDTRQTDYRITHPGTAFSKHPKANITKEVFDAFRKRGFMTGAYFSKPDWNTPDYWWSYFPPKDRNVSYDPAKYPERWASFKKFTHTQMEEIATDYGRVDILWLDGGWVRPKATIDPQVDWQRNIPYDQDIDMPTIAKKLRQLQPGMLIVDRTVAGAYENYATPEQSVPDTYLPYPWESCMTLGNSWSYVPNETYKSANTVVHMLTTIISRNGSLLLNVGPRPDGAWDTAAYDRLAEIGKWMKVNAGAVYDTEADPARQASGLWVFTNKVNDVFAFYRVAETEKTMPARMRIPYTSNKPVKQVRLLGSEARLKTIVSPDHIDIEIPPRLAAAPPAAHAWVFRISH